MPNSRFTNFWHFPLRIESARWKSFHCVFWRNDFISFYFFIIFTISSNFWHFETLSSSPLLIPTSADDIFMLWFAASDVLISLPSKFVQLKSMIHCLESYLVIVEFSMKIRAFILCTWFIMHEVLNKICCNQN